MFKKIYLIALFELLFVNYMSAQDIHLTQFYAAPIYLNPSFAGAEKCTRLTMVARNQWAGVYKGYNTYLFSYDGAITKYNSGIGLLFASDVAGSGGLKTTVFNFNYSYNLQLTRKLSLRFGTQVGGQQLSLSYNNLLFGDQIVRGGNVSTIENPSITKTFLDIGAGSLLYSNNFWLGVSSSHLNSPNQSLTGYTDSRLPIKTSVHTGFKIKVREPVKKNKDEYIVPAINFLHQNKFNQISWGLYYIKSPINFGIWYRGVPFTNDTKQGYSNNDAITFLVAVETEKFRFGYSYDLTLSKLTTTTLGSHEITCNYTICRKRKAQKFAKFLPCPKF